MAETVGALAILGPAKALAEAVGDQFHDDCLQRAGIETLPPADAVVPIAQATRLHDCIFDLADDGAAILRAGGRHSSVIFVKQHYSAFSRASARLMPHGLALRLIGRRMCQRASAFAGSAEVRMSLFDPIVYEIVDGPFSRGDQVGRLCHWQAGFLEGVYRQLLHRGYSCDETACCAEGAKACRFMLSRDIPSGAGSRAA